MSQNRFRPIFLLVSLCLCTFGFGHAARSVTAAIRPGNNALAARGFNELYNMDYDPAIRDLSRLQSEYPDDPFTSNYLLAAEVFKELNRIDALNTETYSSESFLNSKARRPLDLAAQKRIFNLIAGVESLCNARLQKNPNDTDALYARGVALGFRSAYVGMAEKAWISAIRSALAARCFWQLGLAHFGSLIWPTPGTLKVKRKVLRSAGAKPVGRSGSRTQRRRRGSLFVFLPQCSAKAI